MKARTATKHYILVILISIIALIAAGCGNPVTSSLSGETTDESSEESPGTGTGAGSSESETEADDDTTEADDDTTEADDDTTEVDDDTTEADDDTTEADTVRPAAFEIGDTGPAGGIIFDSEYDADTDTWTYREAAPSDLVNESGEATMTHAQALAAATSLVSGDVTDWSLASRTELRTLYTELHQADLGTFEAAPYWSSTVNGPNYRYIDFAQTAGNEDVSTQDGEQLLRGRAVRVFTDTADEI